MEHFSKQLNRLLTVDPRALSQIPQQSVQFELDVLLSVAEIRKAILHTNSNRASGKYDISTEIYKAAVTNATEAFHYVL